MFWLHSLCACFILLSVLMQTSLVGILQLYKPEDTEPTKVTLQELGSFLDGVVTAIAYSAP